MSGPREFFMSRSVLLHLEDGADPSTHLTVLTGAGLAVIGVGVPDALVVVLAPDGATTPRLPGGLGSAPIVVACGSTPRARARA